MMTMRVVLALIAGLLMAAAVATIAFLMLTGDTGIVAMPRLLWSLPVIRAMATAPGWLIVLVAVLPVITHRAASRPIATGTYYLCAAGTGAVAPLASPLGILLVTSGEVAGVLLTVLACGGVAGLCFAAIWQFFVLNVIAAHRDDRTGTIHG